MLATSLVEKVERLVAIEPNTPQESGETKTELKGAFILNLYFKTELRYERLCCFKSADVERSIHDNT